MAMNLEQLKAFSAKLDENTQQLQKDLQMLKNEQEGNMEALQKKWNDFLDRLQEMCLLVTEEHYKLSGTLKSDIIDIREDAVGVRTRGDYLYCFTSWTKHPGFSSDYTRTIGNGFSTDKVTEILTRKEEIFEKVSEKLQEYFEMCNGIQLKKNRKEIERLAAMRGIVEQED